MAINTVPKLNDVDINNLMQSFELASHNDEDAGEYWTARELQILLEYRTWDKFTNVLEKAKSACLASGAAIVDHFSHLVKMVTIGSGAEREMQDYKLSRYACYLIAQNGDSKKKPIAFAQTYFAIQTRRQEVREASQPSEDEKRIFLRNQIKEHNRYLSSAAKEAGVTTPQDFATFHSKGYQGLYTKTVPEIRKHKGLPPSVDILDRMGSTELAANFFRVTQTEEKLKKDAIATKSAAFNTHFTVGRQVREAMQAISGTTPENLPVVESISKVQKRLGEKET